MSRIGRKSDVPGQLDMFNDLIVFLLLLLSETSAVSKIENCLPKTAGASEGVSNKIPLRAVKSMGANTRWGEKKGR